MLYAPWTYLHNIERRRRRETTIGKMRWPTEKSTRRLSFVLFIYLFVLFYTFYWIRKIPTEYALLRWNDVVVYRWQYTPQTFAPHTRYTPSHTDAGEINSIYFSFSFPFLRQRRRFVSARSLCMCVAFARFVFFFYRIFFALFFPLVSIYQTVHGARCSGRESDASRWFIDSDGPCSRVMYDLLVFFSRKKKKNRNTRLMKSYRCHRCIYTLSFTGNK